MSISRWWPLYGLVIRTPRLELRLPREAELPALADVAAAGIHAPDERPFLMPWTELEPDRRGRRVVQSHWSALGSWSAADWSLGLGVFLDGDPLGVVWVGGEEFPVLREVSTTSWLGIEHHGRGYGTEARLGALTLAFDHLGAECAVSEAFLDNAPSLGVSRRLGYEPDGISRDVRDSEAVVSQRLRLTRDRWAAVDRSSVAVDGVPLDLFGLS